MMRRARARARQVDGRWLASADPDPLLTPPDGRRDSKEVAPMARITLRLFTALVAAVTLVTGLGLFAVPSRAASLNEVALYSVYRTSTSDYFETTNPSVAYAAGNSVIRIEGSVFSPSAPQPRGTVPLIRWYSSTQQDNFTTTQWTG